MDSPTSSPVLAESSANSASGKSSPKASPSLSQGLIDLTKQFLTWPQFGIDLSYTGEKDSPEKKEADQEIGSSEYTLAKAQWTPKWPGNFNDSVISQDIDLSVQNDTDPNVPNDTHLKEQNDTDQYVPNDTHLKDQNDQKGINQNDRNDKDQNDRNDKDQNDRNDKDQNDIDKTDQNDTDLNDQEDMDQNEIKRSSKVSFDTTDYSETTEEMGKETESESSEGKQPESTDNHEDDVPTLILQIPPWTEANNDPEEFDNLLYEIPSSTDSDTTVEEDISDPKKWYVEPGNNRNYIKALINYDMNNSWPRALKSKGVFEREEKPQKFKWVINYDNMNYIRSLLRPEIFEKILKRDFLKSKETYTSHQYREMLVN